MDELQNYIKEINPKENDENPPLFYGAKYMCFLENRFIGIATWTQDENVGDSFHLIKKDNGIINVLVPDQWFLIPDKFQNKTF